MSLVLALLGAMRAAFRTRAALALENLALRQQLALLRRRSTRPRFGILDRAFWVWLSRRWSGWRETLHVVRPETVIRCLPVPAALHRLEDDLAHPLDHLVAKLQAIAPSRR